MKVADLVFEARTECCLLNCTAHIKLRNGMELGVMRSEDGNTFGAAMYTPAGLFQRFCGLDENGLQKILDQE